jgi:hypothetical protein
MIIWIVNNGACSLRLLFEIPTISSIDCFSARFLPTFANISLSSPTVIEFIDFSKMAGFVTFVKTCPKRSTTIGASPIIFLVTGRTESIIPIAMV